jgi:hypothetical protein
MAHACLYEKKPFGGSKWVISTLKGPSERTLRRLGCVWDALFAKITVYKHWEFSPE